MNEIGTSYQVKKDYASGIRGLKQIWKTLVWRTGIVTPKSKGIKDPDVKHSAEFLGKMKISKDKADKIFAGYTAKFLDRMGFHTWWNKEEIPDMEEQEEVIINLKIILRKTQL